MSYSVQFVGLKYFGRMVTEKVILFGRRSLAGVFDDKFPEKTVSTRYSSKEELERYIGLIYEKAIPTLVGKFSLREHPQD